ncbi:hypothetical protein evm_012954 [Chilo suppressalis]|nr:hypothetical protein evm_012954 [Chilo suppressalis]
MFAISSHDLHPLALRFLTLWRWVQLVSDCLTFALSILCCQCAAMMPLSPSSSVDDSVEDYKIPPEPVIDAGRASGEPFRPQHLVIDFNHQPGDTDEVSLKCQQLWDVVNNHPDLERMMVVAEAEKDKGKALREISAAVPVHRPLPSPDSESNFPALRTIKKLEEQGTIDTALATSTKSRRK